MGCYLLVGWLFENWFITYQNYVQLECNAGLPWNQGLLLWVFEFMVRCLTRWCKQGPPLASSPYLLYIIGNYLLFGRKIGCVTEIPDNSFFLLFLSHSWTEFCLENAGFWKLSLEVKDVYISRTYIFIFNIYMYVVYTHVYTDTNVLPTYVFYFNLFLMYFLLKEIWTAHKHQSSHFKSECVEVGYCLVLIAFDEFPSFDYFWCFYYRLIYFSLAALRKDVKLSGLRWEVLFLQRPSVWGEYPNVSWFKRNSLKRGMSMGYRTAEPLRSTVE